jgi:hypothetical protein
MITDAQRQALINTTWRSWYKQWFDTASRLDGDYKVIYSLLANVVAQVPDDTWKVMMEHRGDPCDIAGCECHLHVALMFNALNDAREDHKRHIGFANAMRAKAN